MSLLQHKRVMPVGLAVSFGRYPADQTLQAIHQSCSGLQFRQVSLRRRRHKPPNPATHGKRHVSKSWRSSRQPIACRSLSKAQAETVPAQASHTRYRQSAESTCHLRSSVLSSACFCFFLLPRLSDASLQTCQLAAPSLSYCSAL